MIKNVVLVVVDALRADRVFEDTELTPHIDELVQQGVSFRNAYTTINATDPAMTSLNTGRHPVSHGVLNHGDRVRGSEKVRIEQVRQVSELLDEQGFRTIRTGRSMGRWHRNGFDRTPSLDRNRPLERIRATVSNLPLVSRSSAVTNVLEIIAGHGEDAVKEFLDHLPADDPSYAIVHLMDTHAPYSVEEETVEQLLADRPYEGEPLADVVERLGNGIREEQLRNTFLDGESLADISTHRVKAQYDAATIVADRKIGRLVTGLRERNQLDETLLVVLSDHGESLDEHGIYFDHHGLYEVTVRIPMVVAGPDVESDERSELVQITDIAPTVLDSVGVEESMELDGQSLRPLLDGDPSAWEQREAVVIEEAHTQRRRAVRTSDGEKYITDLTDDSECRYCGVTHAPPEELYDLAADPAEQRNRIDDDPETAKRLAKLMTDLVGAFDAPSVDHDRDEPIEYAEEERLKERLRELGYR